MPVIGEEPIYQLGGRSTGCSNGSGFITLFGIQTDSRTTIVVQLLLNGVQLDTVAFQQGSYNAGWIFENLANGAYTVRYTPYVDGSDRAVRNYTLDVACVPVSEPEPGVECVSTFPFQVSPRRGERYFAQFEDWDGNIHRVGYWEQGYTGLPEEVDVAENGLVIDYPGTNNKTTLLSGSGAVVTLNVQRDGLLEAFYTTDERKFRVDHTINGALNWRGYHIPDIYNEPWISVPFHATLQAHDGIGALANMSYLTTAGERYYGRARVIDIMTRCLRKLDLELPLWVAINIWEDTQDMNVEPLSQAYADQSQYYTNENEPLSCKEVLERLLTPYTAFLKQEGAALHLIRFNEVKAPYNRRKINLGTGDSSIELDVIREPYENLHTIRKDGEVAYRAGRQQLTSQPAIKYAASITEYGEYENVILNGDFTRWAGDRPMFWEGDAAIIKVSDGTKLALGFQNLHISGSQLAKGKITNSAYNFQVQSSAGFTFKVDYKIQVDEMLPVPNKEWVRMPNVYLEEGRFGTSTFGRVNFDGNVFDIPIGDIKTGIASPTGFRIDVVVVQQDGTYLYITGTATALNQQPQIPTIPAGCLPLTYISFEGDKVEYTSVNSQHYALFTIVLRIGNYYLKARDQRSYNGNTASYYWATGGDPEPVSFFISDFKNANGYGTAEGAIDIPLAPLDVPGHPYIEIWETTIHRSSLAGVSVTFDNVSLTERALNDIERVIITGENPGQINTPPLEIPLYHGSNIPRTQALLTRADGAPMRFFDGGMELQAITVKDVLAQHSRATLVLSASVAGPVSPISTLKDPFLQNQRFQVDRYSYYAQTGLKEITALEVFGGAGDLLPDRIRVTMNFEPRVTQSQDYRIIN